MKDSRAYSTNAAMTINKLNKYLQDFEGKVNKILVSNHYGLLS
jgi:hypothetical protein